MCNSQFQFICFIVLFITIFLHVHQAQSKSFEIESSEASPLFARKQKLYYTHTDYTVFSIKLNFTNFYSKSTILLKKLKKDMDWFNKRNKLNSHKGSLFENTHEIAQTDHLMKFVYRKVSELFERRKRDLLSLIFGASSLIVSIDNKREITMIKNRQLKSEAKMDSLFHIMEHQTNILEKYSKKVERIYDLINDNFNMVRVKLYESETLMYLNGIYNDINRAMDNGRLPISLVDFDTLQKNFMEFERKIYKDGYVLFQNMEDLGSMQCHVTTEKKDIINFNYLFKVAKNGSAFSVYKHLEAPIRVSQNNTKNHFISVKSKNQYLITDHQTKFSAEANELFYQKCIVDDKYVNNDCKLVLKPYGQTCLSNLFYSKHDYSDNIEHLCDVKVLGREITEAFIITDSMALVHTNGNLKLQITCNNYESERILGSGMNRINLLPNERCYFNSSKFSFFLHNHELNIDEFNYQLSNESINAFSQFASTLDEIEIKGIDRNDTNDFKKLREEMIRFEGVSTSYHYAKMSSVLSTGTIIILALTLLGAGYTINRIRYKRRISKQIKQISKISEDGKS